MEPAPENARPIAASGMARWEPWLLVALAIPVGILIVACFTWPLHVDEAIAVFVARPGVAGILRLLPHDADQPLYFILLHWWIGLAGISEAALRFPSLTFFLLAAWVAACLAREAAGSKRAALYAAFFYAASSEAIYQSMLARPYALMGLLAALSTLFFWKAFFSPQGSRRAEWGYAAANAAGILTHIWSIFLLPAQALACVILLPRRRWWRVAALQIASLAAFALIWGGIFVEQLRAPVTTWTPRMNFHEALSMLTQFYGGHRIGAAFGLISVLLVLAQPKGWTRARELARKPGFLVLAITVAAGLGVAAMVSVIRPVYYPDRYTIIVLPALAAGMGWAFSELASRRWLGAWCCAIIAAYGAVAGLQVTGQKPNLKWMGERLSRGFEAGADRSAASMLCREGSPGDWIVFTSLSGTAMEYYLGRMGCASRFHAVIFPASLAQHRGWDRYPRNQQKLDAEARQLEESIFSAVAPERSRPRIWIFNGLQEQENLAIAGNFPLEFQWIETLAVNGAAFRGLEVYRARGGPAPGSAAIPNQVKQK